MFFAVNFEFFRPLVFRFYGLKCEIRHNMVEFMKNRNSFGIPSSPVWILLGELYCKALFPHWPVANCNEKMLGDSNC